MEALNRVVGHQWRYLMLAFVATARIASRLKYLETLHQRYADRGLCVIGITTTAEDRAGLMREQVEVSFPLISDGHLRLHRAFHIHPAHRHGGLVVLDDQGRIDFFAQVIPPDDALRQLAEKYALGEIDYAPAKDRLAALFEVGMPLPGLPLTSLDGHEHLVLGERQGANLVLVIFTARCASCQLTQFIDSMGLFQTNLVHDSRYRHHRLMVIFAPNFDRDLLTSYQRTGTLPALTYVVDESIDLYDEYATRYDDSDMRPLVVLTGSSGQIVAVDPLSFEGGE